ncbi:unnamed protein product [Closterium sp. NIES-64]|nr:unnamed protein product [Closterium sp. NIES-65]CAI5997642.1 unnamed protein product [Closterium sp. NIES-64]
MAIRVTSILIAVLCLATAASSSSVPRNFTAFHRDGPRRALLQIPPFDPAAALGAAVGAMAGAVQSAAATLASTIAQAPGGLLFDDAAGICLDFGPLPACDFYFDLLGPLGLPSLRVPVVSGGALVLSQQNDDRPVSLAIATSVSPDAGEFLGDKKAKKGGYQVEIDATGPAKYCKCEAAKLAKTVAHAGDQFYATGQPAKVYARTFQKNLPASAFKGCCVRLPLTSVQLKAPNGDVINLNPGDGNKQFPEPRRCLLFHMLTV